MTHWIVSFQCKFGCQWGLCSHASQLKKKRCETPETQTQGRIIFIQKAWLLFIGCKKNIILICGCVWREKVSERKRERIILFIILLSSLYYFIGGQNLDIVF